ncbi:hypothetical protein Pmani_001703 [Petrolisthes manimaculis]|uniref:Endonuclease/exonuclease/phosphatase domain-containing protein n=1 Tax=Petrolisthes manimaculis TaxID=1843537 RepID=A0AAE1QJY0_9EUCA|nr:hypothetical protein Pmani_001703 [Petrolisthes manimaculis]
MEEFASLTEVLLGESNYFVEVLALHITPLNLVLVNLYRPPACENEYFRPIITKLDAVLENLSSPMPELVMVVDFNLPHVSWSDMRTVHGGTEQDKFQAELLFKFAEKWTNNSSQTVEPTINPDITFKDLNFSSNMVDWSNIKHELDEFDWQTEMKNVPVDEKYSTIIATTLKIVTKYTPLRKACYKAPIPRDRKAIMKKRSKLHSRIRHCNNDHGKRSMQDKVERLEEQL